MQNGSISLFHVFTAVIDVQAFDFLFQNSSNFAIKFLSSFLVSLFLAIVDTET